MSVLISGAGPGLPSDDRQWIDHLNRIHHKHWGKHAQVMSYAPGRVEVLGNHTDYNEGTVLSAAIDMGSGFAISDNAGKGLRLYAANFDQHAELDISRVEPHPEHPWANYVTGVFYYLSQKGMQISNWDCTLYGTVPLGSGLSSSAALEMAVCIGALEMCGAMLDRVECAKIGQLAEHNFAGTKSGLMDQFSSLFGRESHLLHTDFRSLAHKTLALPENMRFLMITPQAVHSLSDSPYNRRRESCENAASILCSALNKQKPDRSHSSLRDVSVHDFEALKSRLGEEDRMRAEHIVYEIDRVEKGAIALADGDVNAFGALMRESHRSSQYKFENSAPELDIVVDSAMEAGALGCRLSGGGWGGSLIALVEAQRAEALAQKTAELCSSRQVDVQFRLLSPAEGAHMLMTRETT